METLLASIEMPFQLVPTSPALPVGQSPADLYLSHLGARSVRVVRSDLQTVAGIMSGGTCDAFSMPWAAVRYQHIITTAARLKESYAPATIRRMLSSVRGVLRWAWRLGQMAAEDFHKACEKVAIGGETLPAGRAIAAGELSALATACKADTSPAGRRDAALFTIAYAGLRRAEIVALNLEDYDRETGALKILHGKGGKQRIAYVNDGRARAAMEEWLQARGVEPGPLFVRILKSGRLVPVALSDQAVYDVLQKRATAAGIDDVSPHDFRRTFAGDLLDRGADISTVQKLMGHSSVITTQRYDRRPEKAKQQAVSLLHSPF